MSYRDEIKFMQSEIAICNMQLEISICKDKIYQLNHDIMDHITAIGFISLVDDRKTNDNYLPDIFDIKWEKFKKLRWDYTKKELIRKIQKELKDYSYYIDRIKRYKLDIIEIRNKIEEIKNACKELNDGDKDGI